MTVKVVVATPWTRYDKVQTRLEQAGFEVLRMREPGELTIETLQVFQPRFIFFPHWSWLIGTEIFQRYECVIFHMSDLPYGRGGSPLQNLIARRHQDTVLSALRCVAELDAGPIYLKKPLSLLGTAEEILLRAASLMEDMVLEIALGSLVPTLQVGDPVVFRRRGGDDGNLISLTEIEQVYDYIRMLDADGYPSAFLETSNLRLEFSRASLKPDAVIADVRIMRKK